MITDQDFAHWVYRMYDAEGRLLYVGMTVNPKARLKSWRSVGRAAGHWWPQVSDIRWELHKDKAAAANAERAAIGGESPLHNVYMASTVRVREFDPQRVERAARMLHAYVNDEMTLEQIAMRYGITRERVRQVLNNHDRTMYQLAKLRRKARTRHRRWVNAGSSVIRTKCAVCGELFEGARNRRYCSPVHQKVAVMMRYQTDDNYRARARLSSARSVIRSQSGDLRLVEHAQRVLAGTVAERDHRWICPGSLQFHWAMRAHALGWPLFDAFHEDVQRQIRDAAHADNPEVSA